jgi:hypothetical protein
MRLNAQHFVNRTDTVRNKLLKQFDDAGEFDEKAPSKS